MRIPTLILCINFLNVTLFREHNKIITNWYRKGFVERERETNQSISKHNGMYKRISSPYTPEWYSWYGFPFLSLHLLYIRKSNNSFVVGKIQTLTHHIKRSQYTAIILRDLKQLEPKGNDSKHLPASPMTSTLNCVVLFHNSVRFSSATVQYQIFFFKVRMSPNGEYGFNLYIWMCTIRKKYKTYGRRNLYTICTCIYFVHKYKLCTNCVRDFFESVHTLP